VNAAPPAANHPLIGMWTVKSADGKCVESYQFRANGTAVVTSGDGGLFPKGILIGHIVDARSVRFGIATEARVRLAANFSRLEEVWVIAP